MAWLRRIGRPAAPEPAPRAEPVPEAVERASPGLAALFDHVAEDRSHAVLDLGTAAESSLRLYGRFARWIRFADLTGAAGSAGWAAALKSIPPNPDRPYDILFAWDVLDRLDAEERPTLVARLAEISAPDARLYAVVGTSGNATNRSYRYAAVDTNRMVYRPTDEAGPVGAPILPAEVERLLEPFHVVKAFTSKIGLREYVAVKRAKR